MSVMISLNAADGSRTVMQPQSEPAVIQAMQNLAQERDNWAYSYDWGERTEYPQSLVEYNEQMQSFHVEHLWLQLQLYRLRGDEAAASRTAHNIDQLVNGIEAVPQNLSRDLPAVEDDSREGGAK